MVKIFISYARKDSDVARYIVAELRGRGAEVYIDVESITSGNMFGQIGSLIEESDYFIVLLSPNAEASKWVVAEVGAAFAEKEHDTIIPVLLQPTILKRLLLLASLERVDFRRWYMDPSVDKAMSRLASLVGLAPGPIYDSHPSTPISEIEVETTEEEEEEEGPYFPLEKLVKLINIANTFSDRKRRLSALYLAQSQLNQTIRLEERQL